MEITLTDIRDKLREALKAMGFDIVHDMEDLGYKFKAAEIGLWCVDRDGHDFVVVVKESNS